MKKFFFLSLFVYVIFISACSTPPTPIATQTPQPTISSIPQTFKVTFLAFHDYNGNGNQDGGEPAIKNILLKKDQIACTTDEIGKCVIPRIEKGNHILSVSDDRNVEPAEKMHYLLLSLSEVKEIKKGMNLDIQNDKTVFIPLGQGFLTMPFSGETKYRISNYYDQDRSSCPKGSELHTCKNILDWQGKNKTYDDHTGIDLLAKKGTNVLATSPGKVISSGNEKNAGNYVIIQLNSEFVIQYNHLDKILVYDNDEIKRGQAIGLVGSTGNSSEPHLHLEIRRNGQPIDPYKPTDSSKVLNYWTRINQPVVPF